MLDTLHQIVAGVVLLTVIGIAYGGTFLLRVTRGGVPANDLQKSFFRAGHAHAAAPPRERLQIAHGIGVAHPPRGLPVMRFSVRGRARVVPGQRRAAARPSCGRCRSRWWRGWRRRRRRRCGSPRRRTPAAPPP